MIALIPIFLQYLPQLVKAAQSIPELIGYIQRTKATLSTTGEWTPEQQAEYDKHVEEITSQPHWQPE